MSEGYTHGGPYTDRDTLYELYWEEGMKQSEMAEELGCNQDTISRWMRRLEVPRRERKAEKLVEYVLKLPAPVYMNDWGHMQWRVMDDGVHRAVMVHRLLAASEFGLDEIEGKSVHHKNGIPWDNRPDNIELMTRSEHQSLHRSWESE